MSVRSLADVFADHWRAVIDVQSVEAVGSSLDRTWAYAREIIEIERVLTFEEAAEIRQAAKDKLAEIVARSAP